MTAFIFSGKSVSTETWPILSDIKKRDAVAFIALKYEIKVGQC
jgi:hypothetical protein